jgi:Zn-dependent protease with chaperone function
VNNGSSDQLWKVAPVSLRILLIVLVTYMSAPVWGREGVEVGKNSAFTKLVPAEQVEQSSAQQYAQMLSQAAQKKVLGARNDPQVLRLRAIAAKIIPFALDWNPRAREWQWEVNLIASNQINAFCMPGGKIAFYTGILQKLELTDDEVAMVMGHEIAHALREHARERMGKNAATGVGVSVISQVLGLGQIGQTLTNYGAQVMTLKFSRDDESEADLVGMELAARAGFDPRAGVTLWHKMATGSASVSANGSATAAQGARAGANIGQYFSTHPSGTDRIANIEANLSRVTPLFDQADRQSHNKRAPASN